MRKKKAGNRYKAASVVRPSRTRLIVGIAFLVVTGIGAGLFYLPPLQWSVSEQLGHYPIRQIKVASTFHRLSAAEIRQIALPYASEGFFVTDVFEIQKALKNQPWIADSTVRRVWPDTLSITVTEETAVARWGERSYLNPRGAVFTPDSSVADLAGLPHFNGPHSSGARVLAKYREISGLLQPLGLAVRELQVDGRRSWRLTLDNGIRLALGKEQDLTRIKRFASVYGKLLEGGKDREIVEVDLRYANGFVVRWRDAGADDNNAQMS